MREHWHDKQRRKNGIVLDMLNCYRGNLCKCMGMKIPNNVLYINRDGYVIAKAKPAKPYRVFACKRLPEHCDKILPTVFDTKQQADDWLGVFNVH